jgi:leucyl aminopeptidase
LLIPPVSLAVAEIVVVPLNTAPLAGAVKVTVGGVVSAVMVTDADFAADTLFAASFAHAYAVWLPYEENVTLEGLLELQEQPL